LRLRHAKSMECVNTRSLPPTPTPNAQHRRDLGTPDSRADDHPSTRQRRACRGPRVKARARETAVGMTISKKEIFWQSSPHTLEALIHPVSLPSGRVVARGHARGAASELEWPLGPGITLHRLDPLLKGRTNVTVKTKTRQVGDVSVVDLSGRITLGDGTKSLRETVQGLIGEGKKRILLNLGEVASIDSAGIGELVAALISVQNRGGQLKLLKLTRKVHDAVQITKLYTVFEISDDEPAAIRSFK
jgi:anti-sigma B factor antagonist